MDLEYSYMNAEDMPLKRHINNVVKELKLDKLHGVVIKIGVDYFGDINHAGYADHFEDHRGNVYRHEIMINRETSYNDRICTVAHELRHIWQQHYNKKITKDNDFTDFSSYRALPKERDARKYAKKYAKQIKIDLESVNPNQF